MRGRRQLSTDSAATPAGLLCLQLRRGVALQAAAARPKPNRTLAAKAVAARTHRQRAPATAAAAQAQARAPAAAAAAEGKQHWAGTARAQLRARGPPFRRGRRWRRRRDTRARCTIPCTCCWMGASLCCSRRRTTPSVSLPPSLPRLMPSLGDASRAPSLLTVALLGFLCAWVASCVVAVKHDAQAPMQVRAFVRRSVCRQHAVTWTSTCCAVPLAVQRPDSIDPDSFQVHLYTPQTNSWAVRESSIAGSKVRIRFCVFVSPLRCRVRSGLPVVLVCCLHVRVAAC